MELFIDLGRHGSHVRGWANTVAMLVSQLLQRGAPVEDVCKSLSAIEFNEELVTGHPQIVSARGTLDFIAKVLWHDYLDNQGQADAVPGGNGRPAPG